MFVAYTSLPDDAKVWIYPSSRKFYATEVEALNEKLKSFIDSWKAEDTNFKASYQFLYNRFIIFAADDNDTTLSNTDIDASVAFILKLQETYNIVLLDKMNVCFKQGEFVQYKDLKDFKKLLKNKAVTSKTIIFDNLLTTKHDFENFWEVSIEESWYQRFL